MRQIGIAIKYIFDFVFALIASIITLPIILIAMLVVTINDSGSPSIFSQKRIGKNGKEFTIYKIRTMTNERDLNGELLPDEERLKAWGKIIRKMNIDELPQIWNILRGEMSWIGPRPLLAREMSVMTEEEQKLRQSMRPGISGWEAVNEEKTDNREEMAKYDLEYVRDWSLWFDIKILFQTVIIVLFGKRPDDSLRAPKMEDEKDGTEEQHKSSDTSA